MKTINYSKAVQNELSAINEQSNQLTTKQVKKRINVELICAIGTMVAIALSVYVLHINSLIREF